MPTVTANLKQLSGSADVGSVTITLVGYGRNVPRITGSILSQLSFSVTADVSGNISTALKGNDTITPTGTYYTFAFYSDLGSFVSVAKYSITGNSSIDLSTLTPL